MFSLSIAGTDPTVLHESDRGEQTPTRPVKLQTIDAITREDKCPTSWIHDRER
jgi:hypothetical protein